MSSGVYQKIYDGKRKEPETRPSAAVLGGWLVGNGSSVQIDRLAAFEAATGKLKSLFDRRIDHPHLAIPGFRSSHKNASRKSQFDGWLFSAEDGMRSLSLERGKLVQKEGKNSETLAGTPKTVIAVGSSENAWVVLAPNEIFLFDKQNKKVTSRCSFDGKPTFQGLAIAGRHVYVTTEDGRLHCFGGKTGASPVR